MDRLLPAAPRRSRRSALRPSCTATIRSCSAPFGIAPDDDSFYRWLVSFRARCGIQLEAAGVPEVRGVGRMPPAAADSGSRCRSSSCMPATPGRRPDRLAVPRRRLRPTALSGMVVDDDIDPPADMDKVIWANSRASICARAWILRGCWSSALDRWPTAKTTCATRAWSSTPASRSAGATCPSWCVVLPGGRGSGAQEIRRHSCRRGRDVKCDDQKKIASPSSWTNGPRPRQPRRARKTWSDAIRESVRAHRHAASAASTACCGTCTGHPRRRSGALCLMFAVPPQAQGAKPSAAAAFTHTA